MHLPEVLKYSCPAASPAPVFLYAVMPVTLLNNWGWTNATSCLLWVGSFWPNGDGPLRLVSTMLPVQSVNDVAGPDRLSDVTDRSRHWFGRPKA